MRPLLGVTLLVCLTGCAGAAAGTIANAAINTATAAAVSGVRRANGECFTPCNPGHVCNPATGLCDALPCRGECRSDEKCVVAPIGEKCVPGKDLPPLSQ